jgi:hypothetical protein
MNTTRIDTDWSLVVQALDHRGFAIVRNILTADQCLELICTYDDDQAIRKTINMRHYRFGDGEYKYLKYPLPPIVQSLRENLYQHLHQVANKWMVLLQSDTRYPADHGRFINTCRDHQQLKPTPLILRYGQDGHNTLHQDMYGEIFFPLQVVVMLSQVALDYTGGSFVLTQQVPRAQSTVSVEQPDRGDAIIFTTNFRPIKGTRGYYRATMKHGVSHVKSGTRYTLGIIFHDAA